MADLASVVMGLAFVLGLVAAVWWLVSCRPQAHRDLQPRRASGAAHGNAGASAGEDLGVSVERTIRDASELVPAMQRALAVIAEGTGFETLVLLRDHAYACSGVPRRLAEHARTSLMAGADADSVARKLTVELGSSATAVPIRGADGKNAYLIIATDRGEDLLSSPLVRSVAASLARSIDELLERRRDRQEAAQAELDAPVPRPSVHSQKLRIVGG